MFVANQIAVRPEILTNSYHYCTGFVGFLQGARIVNNEARAADISVAKMNALKSILGVNVESDIEDKCFGYRTAKSFHDFSVFTDKIRFESYRADNFLEKLEILKAKGGALDKDNYPSLSEVIEEIDGKINK